jgi:methoxymalonate biosynthesis acyl carrier protein
LTEQRQPAAASPGDTVVDVLLRFLARRTARTYAPDEDLFATGGISSLFALELVLYLEQEFDVEVTGSDLRLDNFRTVTAMAVLVRRLGGIRGDGR